MAAYPHASPAPALLTRRVVRLALGASALAAVTVVLARRVDLAPLLHSDVAWGWIAASLALNLASVAGKAIVWKAALDALPGQRPRRATGMSCRRCSSASCSTPCSSPAWARSRASQCSGAAGGSRGDPIPASTIAGTVLAEQLVLGVALALCVVALAPVLHLPHMVWQLADRVHARARRSSPPSLMVVMRKARGRLAGLAAGLSRGQALFRKPRATAVAMGAGTISWAAQIAGIWAALEAFHIHVGLAGAGLVFVSSTIVQLFPFWPGNLGIFQLGVAGPLVSVYAVSTANAVAFSVGLQLVEGLLGVGLGLFFLAREGLSLSSARQLAATPEDAAQPA